MSKPKLAIVATHPVQYYAPLFQLLTARNKIAVHVFYTAYDPGRLYDPGFKKEVEWDLPLLDGYSRTIVENKAADPGSHHFFGADNPVIVQQILDYQPDAILLYGWAYKSHLQVMRYFKTKVPVWFRGDSTLIDRQPWHKRIARFLFLKWVYRYVDKAFYTGSANRDYFIHFGLKKSQLFFAPHAVDNRRFSAPDKEGASRLRNKLNIPEKGILILFAGKLEEKKDPKALLKAFIEINNKNSFLLFVGSGPLEADLKRMAADIPGIYFQDFINQSEMPVYYQACNLFCLPSRGPGETWGLAVNEAMAAGKAILVSDKVGCANNLVINGKNGLIFTLERSFALREALQQLLQSPERLLEMGQESKLIIRDFSFEKQAEMIENALLSND